MFVDFNIERDEATEASTNDTSRTTHSFEEHQGTTDAAMSYVVAQPTARDSIQIMLEFHHRYQVRIT